MRCITKPLTKVVQQRHQRDSKWHCGLKFHKYFKSLPTSKYNVLHISGWVSPFIDLNTARVLQKNKSHWRVEVCLCQRICKKHYASLLRGTLKKRNCENNQINVSEWDPWKCQRRFWRRPKVEISVWTKEEKVIMAWWWSFPSAPRPVRWQAGG